MRRGDPSVDIALLGGLRVEADGRPLVSEPLPRRAEVVLARLALEPDSPVSRDVLADAVWGDELPPSWRPALRNVVTDVRRALAEDAAEAGVELASAGDGYALRLPSGAAVDLLAVREATHRAERAMRDGDHQRAIVIGRDALPATRLRILPGADGEWVEALRAETVELRVRLKLAVGEAALAVGDVAQAEDVARRLAELAPERDDACRLLMRALSAAGNRAGALAAYDAFRRVLADRLWTAPAPETEALAVELAAGGAPGTVTPGAMAAGPLLRLARQTPFVGRGALLDALTARLREATGGARVVVVVGEAGAGKTRLAAELAARVNDAGTTVLYGRADDRLAAPYGPLLEALDGALATSDPRVLLARLGAHADVLTQLLPSLPAPGERTAPDRLHLQRALVAALRALAEERPTLLVLDDMQWCARAELDVLAMLSAAPARVPLLVVVLVREGAPLPLRERPRVERLMLPPLTVEEIAALADAMADGDAPSPAARIRRLTGGNALLTAELLRKGADAARDRPLRIDQLVRERLAPLPADVEAALRVAAVAGLEFDPRLVGAAAGTGREPLDAAADAGLLIPATRDAEWLAFRHALVRGSLLDRLDPAERRRIHEHLGTALEQRASDELVELAYHFGAARGDWRRAVRYGLPVARAAQRAGVYEDVVAIARRTLAALDEAGDPDPDARLDLEILLGGAQRALGDPAGAATLRGAFAEAGRRDDAQRGADAALGFSDAGAMSDEAFVDDALLAIYEEALAALDPADLERRARLLGRLASAYAWRAGGDAVERTRAEALSLAARISDDVTRAGVLTAVRRSLSNSQQLEQQGALDDELEALAARLDDPGLGVRAALWRFESAIERGDGEPLEELLGQAARGAAALQMGHYHHSLAYARASLALLRGAPDEAEELVERAAAIGAERGLDPIVVQAIRLTQLLGVRFEQGRLEDLRGEADAFFRPAGVPEWRSVLAYIDAASGNLDTVGADVDALLDGFDAHGVTMTCSIGMLAHVAAPIAALGDRDRAARLRAIIAPFPGRAAFFAIFAGPVDFHLGLLARTLGDETAARDHFAAAAAFSERLGAPLWSARARAQ